MLANISLVIRWTKFVSAREGGAHIFIPDHFSTSCAIIRYLSSFLPQTLWVGASIPKVQRPFRIQPPLLVPPGFISHLQAQRLEYSGVIHPPHLSISQPLLGCCHLYSEPNSRSLAMAKTYRNSLHNHGMICLSAVS